MKSKFIVDILNAAQNLKYITMEVSLFGIEEDDYNIADISQLKNLKHLSVVEFCQSEEVNFKDLIAQRFSKTIESFLSTVVQLPKLTKLDVEMDNLELTEIQNLMIFKIIPFLTRHSPLMKHLELRLRPKQDSTLNANQNIIQNNSLVFKNLEFLSLCLPDRMVFEFLEQLDPTIMSKNTLKDLQLHCFGPFDMAAYFGPAFQNLNVLLFNNRQSLVAMELKNFNINQYELFEHENENTIYMKLSDVYIHGLEGQQDVEQVTQSSIMALIMPSATNLNFGDFKCEFFQLTQFINKNSSVECLTLAKLTFENNNNKVNPGFVDQIMDKPKLEMVTIDLANLSVPPDSAEWDEIRGKYPNFKQNGNGNLVINKLFEYDFELSSTDESDNEDMSEEEGNETGEDEVDDE